MLPECLLEGLKLFREDNGYDLVLIPGDKNLHCYTVQILVYFKNVLS